MPLHIHKFRSRGLVHFRVWQERCDVGATHELSFTSCEGAKRGDNVTILTDAALVTCLECIVSPFFGERL